MGQMEHLAQSVLSLGKYHRSAETVGSLACPHIALCWLASFGSTDHATSILA